jgi:hypothetical protein
MHFIKVLTCLRPTLMSSRRSSHTSKWMPEVKLVNPAHQSDPLR